MTKEETVKVLALDRFVEGVEPERDIYPHLAEEARSAWENYKGGVLREIYFRMPPGRAGAVLMLECADLEEAREVVDALPLTRRGLIGWDLIPLGPFIPPETLFSAEATAEGGG